MRSVQTKQFSRFLPSTYVGHVKLAAANHCTEMAAMFNSLSFVYKNWFLHKYCVKRYDYNCKVVQWDIIEWVFVAAYCLNDGFNNTAHQCHNY